MLAYICGNEQNPLECDQPGCLIALRNYHQPRETRCTVWQSSLPKLVGDEAPLTRSDIYAAPVIREFLTNTPRWMSPADPLLLTPAVTATPRLTSPLNDAALDFVSELFFFFLFKCARFAMSGAALT